VERPDDPGRIFRAPHIIQLVDDMNPPMTLFSFGLTISPSFCFLREFRERYPVRADFTEADGYIFLDVVLDYIASDFKSMYKRDKLVISSEIRHFAELAAKKGFRVSKRTNNGAPAGWRALKNEAVV
jgi:hypothetical protein